MQWPVLFAARVGSLIKLLQNDPLLLTPLIGIVLGGLLGFLLSKTDEFQPKTTDDPDEIIEEFEKRRLRGLAAYVLGAPVLAASFMLPAFQVIDPVVSGIAGFICSAIAVFVAYFTWKCPACGSALRQDNFPKQCPTCGVQLQLADTSTPESSTAASHADNSTDDSTDISS